MFNNCFSGKRVLITGHTGFKGSWLALWLEMLGAEVTGYALEPPTHPNHISLLKLCGESVSGDVRDINHLKKVILDKQPHIVFHLAAQPLVRYSYQNPVETFETNVMGTVNLLETCRLIESLEGIIIITSDKCYENRELTRGYRENDTLGGNDPYSCSKGCAELVTTSYRRSFFSTPDKLETESRVASVRAGNVIGGGDWGVDRLMTDVIRATVTGESLILRNPDAIRPWQHVLDALSGYLLIGKHFLENKPVGGAWNFGPEQVTPFTVRELVEMVSNLWKTKLEIRIEKSHLKETIFLGLDTGKAKKKLGWTPIWNIKESVGRTVDWFKAFYIDNSILSEKQIQDYMRRASVA
ncbi:CDP-glucose 4,6-dehydratase [Thermodesulfobacteriota bacterium]